MYDTHAYFKQLSETLGKELRAIPRLIIDLDRLDANIACVRHQLYKDTTLRIVVKSLPAFGLLDYVMKKLGTSLLMVFHQPFLSDICTKLGKEADILLGKPMPVNTAAYFYKMLPVEDLKMNPYTQIQWLVDTKERVEQYIDLAQTIGQRLRINIELDVGLHRGGVQSHEELRDILTLIAMNQHRVTLSGFLGYDPHVVKVPKLIRGTDSSLKKSNQLYESFKEIVRTEFPVLWKKHLVHNGSGSPTLSLHNTPDSPLNDVAAGSCFVKPSSFDIPTLNEYKPACFIATPVLKKLKGTTIPGIEKARNLLSLLDQKNQNSYFIYGGFWKADYCYPSGIRQNSLFGPSTNQTMLNAPNNCSLDVDDYVFLRPQQSEFVFLQFGKILAIRGNNVEYRWDCLSND